MKKAIYTIQLFIITLFSNNVIAADYYWVGGTGNWSDYATHWATSSGGSSFHIQIPQSADNVFFDANSFSANGQSVVIDKTIVSCKNMTWTGVTNTPQLTTSDPFNVLNIYGSLTLTSGMTVFNLGPIYFLATTTGNTITTAGIDLNTDIYFDGNGGGWILQDDITLGYGGYNMLGIWLNKGSLNTNGKTVSTSTFYSVTDNIRSLIMGSSTFNLSIITNAWQIYGSNMTLNSGTSTINITCNIPAWSPLFTGGGNTYNNLHFTGTLINYGKIEDGGNTFKGDVSFASKGIIGAAAGLPANIFKGTTTFYSTGDFAISNTFNHLTFSPGFTYTLAAEDTQTVTGTFSVNGTCSAPIEIKSGGATPAIISKSSGTVTADYITLTNVTATGGAAFTANHAIDGGGNSGWTMNIIPSQNLYWIGNGGNWSDGNHWSLSSGGAPFGCTPGKKDNIFFDANSFSAGGQTVVIDLPNVSCKDITWTGVTHTPEFKASVTSSALNIYGSLTLVPGMTIGSIMSVINFRATNMGNTVTTGGHNLNTNIFFDGIGGGWTLLDDFTSSPAANNAKTIYLYNGSLNTNGKTVSTGRFISNNTNIRTLTLGSSIINVEYNGIYGWDIGGIPLTLNAGTSTINMNGKSPGNIPRFLGGGKTYYNLFFTDTSTKAGSIEDGNNIFNGNVSFMTNGMVRGSANTFKGTTTFYQAGEIQQSNTFNNLKFTPGFTYTLAEGKTQTITGNLSADGTCSLPVALKSSTTSPATISKVSGTVTVNHVSLTNITASGGAVFTASNSTDGGGNSGWIISSAPTQDLYWIGNGGNWSDGNHWSAVSGGAPFGCAPGVGDNVIFDANSFSANGQSVTVDLTNANCKSMTWKGVTHNPEFKASAVTNALNIYGSLTLDSVMTVKELGTVNFLSTVAGNTISTAGLNMNTNLNFNGVGGGWILLDDLMLGLGSSEYGVTLANGSLNTNGKTLSIGKFVSNTSTARTLIIKSSVINISYYFLYAWHINGTNMTLSADSSTINMTNNDPAWSPYFIGGGQVYNNLYYTGTMLLHGIIGDGGNTFNGDVSFASDGVTGGNTFNGNTIFYKAGNIQNDNIFNNLTFSPGFIYTLAAEKSQTIKGALNISGTGGFPVRIQSDIIGSPATFSKSSGIVCTDFVRLSDNTATGGADFYAGANSEDMGGNSGWSFTAGPGGTASVTLSATPAGGICTGTIVQFTAVPSNGGTSPQYQWKKNGTDKGNNTPDYADSTLVNNDVISCTMTSSAGCGSAATVTDSIIVSIVPGGVAGTITALRDTLCEGTPVSLQLSGSSGIVQWQSSLSPTGFTDISGADTTTYSEALSVSTYFRVVADAGTCADTSAVLKITVNPSPIADFNFTTMGTQVSFTDNSTGATVYEWDFGDGQYSAEQNPVHDYAVTGVYRVCLNVFNGSNCSFTICKDIEAGSVTGVASLSGQNHRSVYPNPFDNKIIFSENNAGSMIFGVQIFDVQGRIILNENIDKSSHRNLEINTSAMAKGVYYIKVITRDNVNVESVVKQ